MKPGRQMLQRVTFRPFERMQFSKLVKNLSSPCLKKQISTFAAKRENKIIRDSRFSFFFFFIDLALSSS